MSLSEPSPSPAPPPQHFVDSGGYWSQFPMNNDQFDPHSQLDQPYPPFKRPRNFEETQSNPRPSLPPPINKGTTNIFFKTRMCAKFKVGMCRNGEGCNFAHGIEDLRQPPPNWQELVGPPRGDEDHRPSDNNWDDDQKIIHKMKLCKKFYNGEECPYGDRCNFLHEERAKFRDDSGRFRETSAICIGTNMIATNSSGHGNGSNSIQPEAIRNVNVVVGGGDARLNMKPVYWKTKLCTKWEITGQCPFGEKCHFAHGLAELQAHGGRIEGEAMSIAPGAPLPINETCPLTAATIGDSVTEERQAKRSLLKWKGHKKINQIYADWLDDLPLVHNLSDESEI